MSDDPYTILGVSKGAKQAEIQKAYRRLAKTHHPDINPGDKGAEARFKTIAGAYDIVGDAAKRKRFDSGEIDAQGGERPRQRAYRDFAESDDNPYTNSAGFSDFEGSEDILAELFARHAGGRAGSRGGNFQMRGADMSYNFAVDFLDAVNGAKRQVSLPDGATLDVTLPPGIEDGQTLRLRGKGAPGFGGGPPGDALIIVSVRPHHLFTRRGDDILVEAPLSLAEAVLGGKVTIPTPTGSVQMTVPKWTNSGAVLRLKGKGAPGRGGIRGDEYVTLRVTLPEKPDADVEAFVSRWASQRPGGDTSKMETLP